MHDEFYISVDVETSGPIPGIYSLLSVGACVVKEPAHSIYIELFPDGIKYNPEAVAVTGLDIVSLKNTGVQPKEAMIQLEQWILQVCPKGHKVVFVGLNAPFDWSFINYYFHKYIGSNPFGFTAIDIKSYYMGMTGCSWGETKSSNMSARFKPKRLPNHNALDDAKYQAELFALIQSEGSNL